jgi:oligoribonuclease NrnB/cAMP/cGMP phosphodiesterase (DHH superfamily)
MFNKELESIDIKKWDTFISDVKSNDRIGICYHSDNDGLCGALYSYLALTSHQPNLNISFFWITNEEFDFNSIKDWISRNTFEHCIFLDISIENDQSLINFLSEHIKGRVFIFDHHLMHNEYVERNNVILINPTPTPVREGQRPIPTFLFSYLLSHKYNLYYPEWLLILSIFSEGLNDYFGPELMALFKIKEKEENFRELYKNSIFSKISILTKAEFDSNKKTNISLSAAIETIQKKESEQHLYSILIPQLEDLAKQITIEINSYIEHWLNHIKLQHLELGKCLIIPVASKYTILGPVCSIIRGEYTDKVVITYTFRNDIAIVELRTGNKSSLNFVSIIKDCVENNHIEIINYGGHPTAAGLSIKKHHLNKFLILFESRL